ncbi:ARMC6 isoform 6, partial [Pan troglodytes]
SGVQELVKQVLSTLRAIAGNDDVKDAIVHAGGTESIVAAMTQHLTSPQVCEQSCAALCFLALRKPDNSRIIVEGGGAVAALQAMKAHPQKAGVQVGRAGDGGRQAGVGCAETGLHADPKPGGPRPGLLEAHPGPGG